MDDSPQFVSPTAAPQNGSVAIITFGLLLIWIPLNSLLSGASFLQNRMDFDQSLLVLALAALLPLVYWNHWRVIGFIPPALTGILAVSTTVALTRSLPDWLAIFGYGCLGLIGGSVFRYGLQPRINSARYLLKYDAKPANGFVQFPGIRGFDRILIIAVFVTFAATNILPRWMGMTRSPSWYNICAYQYFAACILLTLFAWHRLLRYTYEIWVESWICVMYKIRGTGPGLKGAPIRGPLLVIANHACWWDPLFLAGVLPRPITPMMTSGFYDIWHLRPLMKHVIHAIRVPEKAVRHEAPEIQEAVAALERGECVVIFPEGYLRRKEEVPLRRFGRGVYEILKARPATPVLACWIDGAWGSWCSWKDGLPLKGKRIDFRRRITVGMSMPITLDPALFENHWSVRGFLMNAVSGARVHLGLEPLPAFTVPAKDEPDEAAK